MPADVILDDLGVDAPWECVGKDGSRRIALQVRRLDDATFVLRQSSRATWEAPLLYLLVGSERALLFDTGAVEDPAVCPVRATVDALLAARPDGPVPLVVLHSHGHGDHTAGDAQLADRPDTTVVPADREGAHAFLGLEAEESVVGLDLGGRALLVTAIPGHDERSVAVIDPERGLMLSGDTVYPGRLYVDDLPAARRSLDRLVDLAAEHGTRHVLGGHIEHDARRRGIPVMTRFHPSEAPLVLTPHDLVALRDALHAAPGPGVHPGGPMTLFVGGCTPAVLRMLARTGLARLTGRG